MQGQRPVDLWASVINVESDIFGRYPQVYVIASSSGLEIGFGVAIHEDDYYNAEIKQRNRAIVPILYQKLPDPASAFVRELDNELENDGVWKFGLKTRQGEMGNFTSLSELIRFLKSSESSAQGGGSVYQIIEPERANSSEFDLGVVFSRTVARFAPLMRLLSPSHSDSIRLTDQETVDRAAQNIPEFNPADLADGRKKLLQAVAVRQGQAKFREKLLDAYNSRCAVTGTAIAATLQAAHIVPYRGPEMNSVQNGVLLRADIHNLFDLGLMQIDPSTLRISLSEELKSTSYGKLDGRKLRAPLQVSKRPSQAALSERLKLFS